MSEAIETPYVSPRRAGYVVLVLLLAYFICFLDRQIITLLLPSLKADLHVSDTQVSLIQGLAFALIYASAGLSMGWLADHVNRRNMLLAGITFWTLATLACGFAGNFWELFAARMAMGMGEACLSPTCASMIADYFRPTQRGRAMGVMITGAPLGAAGSLFIGGVLLQSLTHGALASLVPHGWAPWRSVFVAIAAPGLLVAALVATLKEPPRRRELTTAQTDASPLTLVGFFRDHLSAVALFFGMISLLALAATALSSWAPTVLMRIYGMAPTQAGGIYGAIMLFCAGTAGACSGVVSDALVRRWQFSGRVLIPAFILPVELGAQTVLTLTHNPALVVAAMAVSAFNLAFMGATYLPIIQDLFPNQLRGRATAVVGVAGTVVGLGCGPTLVALVTDQVFHTEMMLQTSVGVVDLSAVAIAFLLALCLPRSYAKARRLELTEPQSDAPLASPRPPRPRVETTMSTETHRTYCRNCQAACGLVIETEDNHITSVRGDRAHAVTQGFMCIKGTMSGDLHNGEGRLASAQKCDRRGGASNIDVEQALDEIAAKLSEIIKQHGPNSVALYFGTGVKFNTLGTKALQSWLLQCVGSPYLYSSSTIDQSAKWVTMLRMGMFLTGKPVIQDIDVMLAVGSNPYISHWGFLHGAVSRRPDAGLGARGQGARRQADRRRSPPHRVRAPRRHPSAGAAGRGRQPVRRHDPRDPGAWLGRPRVLADRSSSRPSMRCARRCGTTRRNMRPSGPGWTATSWWKWPNCSPRRAGAAPGRARDRTCRRTPTWRSI